VKHTNKMLLSSDILFFKTITVPLNRGRFQVVKFKFFYPSPHFTTDSTSGGTGLHSKVRGYQFFESVSYPYPQRTIRIRIANRYPYPIRIRYDSFSCIQSKSVIEANSHWWPVTRRANVYQ